jgi:hypothetical protein
MIKIGLFGGMLGLAFAPGAMAQEKLAPGETKQIAEEAIVSGLPW